MLLISLKDSDCLNRSIVEPCLKLLLEHDRHSSFPCVLGSDVKADVGQRRWNCFLQTANPIMNSPLVKRRSHFPPAAVKSSDPSCKKRSSLNPDRRFLLEQVRHHQSHWTLANDVKQASQPLHLRRYASEIFLSKTASTSSVKEMFAERGAPEGQEDPSHVFSSERIQIRQRMPIRTPPSKMVIKDKCSSVYATAEAKRALLVSAKNKWISSATIHLPLPVAIKNIPPPAETDDLQVVSQPLEDEHNAQQIAISLGLDADHQYKVRLASFAY